jgi:hypothetical protein
MSAKIDSHLNLNNQLLVPAGYVPELVVKAVAGSTNRSGTSYAGYTSVHHRLFYSAVKVDLPVKDVAELIRDFTERMITVTTTVPMPE